MPELGDEPLQLRHIGDDFPFDENFSVEQRAAGVNTMAAGFLKDPALYACADPDMGYPTQEQASLYARILKYAASAPYNLDFNLYAGDQMELFMDGAITIDDLVERLNEKYQMTQMG